MIAFISKEFLSEKKEGIYCHMINERKIDKNSFLFLVQI